MLVLGKIDKGLHHGRGYHPVPVTSLNRVKLRTSKNWEFKDHFSSAPSPCPPSTSQGNWDHERNCPMNNDWDRTNWILCLKPDDLTVTPLWAERLEQQMTEWPPQLLDPRFGGDIAVLRQLATENYTLQSYVTIFLDSTWQPTVFVAIIWKKTCLRIARKKHTLP